MCCNKRLLYTLDYPPLLCERTQTQTQLVNHEGVISKELLRADRYNGKLLPQAKHMKISLFCVSFHLAFSWFPSVSLQYTLDYPPLLFERTLQCVVYLCRHGFWLAAGVHPAIWLAISDDAQCCHVSPGRCSKVSSASELRVTSQQSSDDVINTDRGHHSLQASHWLSLDATALWLAIM